MYGVEVREMAYIIQGVKDSSWQIGQRSQNTWPPQSTMCVRLSTSPFLSPSLYGHIHAQRLTFEISIDIHCTSPFSPLLSLHVYVMRNTFAPLLRKVFALSLSDPTPIHCNIPLSLWSLAFALLVFSNHI